MIQKRLIIGLTGRFGAGCTTTRDFFVLENRFKKYALSKPLKVIAKSRIKNFNKKAASEKRTILQDIGDELRKKNKAVLVHNPIKDIMKRKLNKVVIDGIRNTAEVDALRKKFKENFFLIAIDAETETRWGRLKHIYGKDRPGFDLNDNRDEGKDQPKYGQKVKECMEKADILINNEESFYIASKNKRKSKRKDRKSINKYGYKVTEYLTLMEGLVSGNVTSKPQLDELYMHQAYSIALLSECSRRRVGTIIVREKELQKAGKISNIPFRGRKESYIIASGHNNVPIGETSCRWEYFDAPVKCYRKIVSEKFLKEVNHKFCRKCGERLIANNYVCKKCEHDNKELPSKLLDVCRSVHAEEAAILQAVKLGSPSLEGAKLYTSLFPCMLCSKIIINSGIKKIVYLESYIMRESLALDMFRKCGIVVSKFEGANPNAFSRFYLKK